MPIIWPFLLVLAAVETYLLLPPGIPLITSPGLVPIRYRLTNYAFIGLIAYSLNAYGFEPTDSLGIASYWMTLGVYLVFDYFYDVALFY